MATQTAGSSDFIKNLGRLYGTYTGTFLGFIILLAILEQIGVPNRVLGYLFVGFTIAVYALIGVMTRTAEISEYYVAGRRVPAFYNGMATGADWMSAASFVGMAGTLFLLGYDGLAFVLGWTGGYVLVSVLIGPYLRKFGAYTVPDFMAFRFGGNFARFIAVIVLVCCSFTYVTAQIYGTGLIASRFLGMPFELAVFAGLAGILLCSMLGGMRAVTWTQVAQYIILIIAYMLPVVWLSVKQTGVPIPQAVYGYQLQKVTAAENRLKADPKEQEVIAIFKKQSDDLAAKLLAQGRGHEADELQDHNQRPRRRFGERQTIHRLRLRQPAVLRRRLRDVCKHGVRAAEGDQRRLREEAIFIGVQARRAAPREDRHERQSPQHDSDCQRSQRAAARRQRMRGQRRIIIQRNTGCVVLRSGDRLRPPARQGQPTQRRRRHYERERHVREINAGERRRRDHVMRAACQRPLAEAQHGFHDNGDDHGFEAGERACHGGDLAIRGVNVRQRQQNEDRRQDKERARHNPARRAMQQPADVYRQLLRLRPRQQHAVIERVEELALLQPAPLVHQDAMHQGDLRRRAAERDQPDPPERARQVGEADRVHGPAGGQPWLSISARRRQA